LVDLEEWMNEEVKRLEENVYPLLGRVKKRREISLLDFAPEFKKILRENTYGLWLPPGSIKAISQMPLSNLASMLDKGILSH